jgi:hypothetical protein
MTTFGSDRDIVIRHIIIMTLPKILARDAIQIQDLGLFTAYTEYIEKLQLVLESEQMVIRNLLRSRNIKIVDLISKDGIQCVYAVRGYEKVINMLSSTIKSACDSHLKKLMGLSDADSILRKETT